MLQVNPICSMMGIIVALLIRARSYHYWKKMSRILHGCAIDTTYKKILFSQYLWASILMLQRILRHYQIGGFTMRGIKKREQKYFTVVISLDFIN